MRYFKRTFFHKVLKPVSLFCFLWLLSLNTYSNEAYTKIDAAFYFSVLIDAKKDVVWPFLFQVNKWKYSVARLENEHLTGEQEGGVVAVYQKVSAVNPGLLIKTLKIIPNQHYSFSIYSYAGQFVGFAAYDLIEKKGETRLSYNVYLQTTLAKVSDREAEVHRQKIIEGMEVRQPKELAALKALVEA